MKRSLSIIYFFYIFLLTYAYAQTFEEKIKFCSRVNSECNNQISNKTVCGIRPAEQNGFASRKFSSVCELLKYNCEVEDTKAYLNVKIEYCEETSAKNDAFHNNSEKPKKDMDPACQKYECEALSNATEVCAIQADGQGFRIRKFQNYCEMLKYNCDHSANFHNEPDHVCKDIKSPMPIGNSYKKSEKIANNKLKNKPFVPYKENVVIVDGSIFDRNGNINDTVNNFFTATHLFDMPVKEVSKQMFDGETRRRLIKIAGPLVVFQPAVHIPKVVNESYEYFPTLGSCYHRCPEKCPDTYKPVCGTPGTRAREPSVVFQNHCYMDAAQCKMNLHGIHLCVLHGGYNDCDVPVPTTAPNSPTYGPIEEEGILPIQDPKYAFL